MVEVADQLGCSPEVVLKAYAGIWAECGIEDRKRAAQAIFDARTELLVKDWSKNEGDLPKTQEPTPGLEPGTPSLRVKCSTN